MIHLKRKFEAHKLKRCLFSCKLPRSHAGLIPISVSLVKDKFETPSNLLSVIYNNAENEEEDNNHIMVCAKGHTFPNDDKSLQLIEWIEVLRSLGTNISIYHYLMHPNIMKV